LLLSVPASNYEFGFAHGAAFSGRAAAEKVMELVIAAGLYVELQPPQDPAQEVNGEGETAANGDGSTEADRGIEGGNTDGNEGALTNGNEASRSVVEDVLSTPAAATFQKSGSGMCFGQLTTIFLLLVTGR